MIKLLNVDAAGERALRVVAYFDRLMANEPHLDAVVRAAAIIADCPAGLELRNRGVSLRFSPEGNPLNGPAEEVSEARSLSAETDGAGGVWLERAGAPQELDEFIVERFALTVDSVVHRLRPPSDFDFDFAGGFSDPALAQLFVNDRANETERSRAATLIGLHASSQVQIVALELVAEQSLEAVSRLLRDTWSRPVFVSALSRQLGIAIVSGTGPVEWSGIHLEGRAASGSVVETLGAPTSWLEARETLRFADAGSPWPHHLDAADLGSIRLLARIEPTIALADPDVVAIGRIAESPSGAEAIRILDQYLHADSIRSAARATNFHHSSLQVRIARIARDLGIDVRVPSGRQRATTALLLWRLAQNA